MSAPVIFDPLDVWHARDIARWIGYRDDHDTIERQREAWLDLYVAVTTAYDVTSELRETTYRVNRGRPITDDLRPVIGIVLRMGHPMATLPKLLRISRRRLVGEITAYSGQSAVERWTDDQWAEFEAAIAGGGPFHVKPLADRFGCNVTIVRILLDLYGKQVATRAEALNRAARVRQVACVEHPELPVPQVIELLATEGIKTTKSAVATARSRAGVKAPRASVQRGRRIAEVACVEYPTLPASEVVAILASEGISATARMVGYFRREAGHSVRTARSRATVQRDRIAS